MSEILDLNVVDVDGAVREAADKVIGDTRMGFLRQAGIGAGALMGGGAVLSALAPSAFAASSGRPPAKFGKGDVGILNYALTLEYLEAAFYAQAASKIKFTDPHLKALATHIAADEKAHVGFLRGALGSKALKSPKFDFGAAVTNQATWLKTAQVLENTGVGAYFGQGFNIADKNTLKAAISILTIEARHAGAFGYINDRTAKSVTPNGAFDVPLTAQQVLAGVAKTHFIKG